MATLPTLNFLTGSADSRFDLTEIQFPLRPS